MIGVHPQPTDETLEHALFYALGSLSSVERSAFEDHRAVATSATPSSGRSRRSWDRLPLRSFGLAAG